MSWNTINSEKILETSFVKVDKNKVQLPNGTIIDDFYTVKIQDAATVVALTDDGYILLKKEYRYACKCDMIECPAGMIEDGEDPYHTIQRELLEETGYVSNEWTYLGPAKESTAKLTNTLHIYLAKNCVKVADLHLDQTEDLELMKVSFIEAVKMVMDQRIWANGTAHAILKVARMMGV